MMLPETLPTVDEIFTVEVMEAGIVPIPRCLRVSLGLEAGEMVAIRRRSATLNGTVLGALEEATPSVEPWRLLEVLSGGRLTVLEWKGLPIPESIFTVERGDLLNLQVLSGRPCPELYIYPADLRGVRRGLAFED